MAAITLEELVKKVCVCPEKLNESTSDDHLREIALILTSWRTVASHLDLDENDLDDAEEGGRKVKDKSLKALQIWKGKFGFKATYRKLVEVLLSLAMANVAEKVCHLLIEDIPVHVSITDNKSKSGLRENEGSEEGTTNGADTGLTSVLSIQPPFQQLSSSEQEELKEMLYEDVRKMQRQFASLVTTTCDSVEERIPVVKFAKHILALGAYRPAPEERDRSLLDEHRQEIKGAKSISEIFIILSAYWNYLNYEVLEYIIEHYGTSEDTEKLRKYKERLHDFCKRRIFELPMPVRGNGTENKSSPKQEKLHVKLDVREDIPSEQFNQIKGKIAKILHVRPATLQIYSIDKGCVQLTFLIPKFVAQEIFPLSHEQTSALSKDVSVIRLECGDYTFEAMATPDAQDPKLGSDPPKPIADKVHPAGTEVSGSIKGDTKKEPDFLSFCKEIDEQLCALAPEYNVFTDHDLKETREQFEKKQILISVIGCLNTGKSTLLNSLLSARLLPMRARPATGLKVHIQHIGDASILDQNAATTNQHNKSVLHLEYTKQQPEDVKGDEEIFKRLEILNSNVRRGGQCDSEIPKCTLKTPVSFLACAPSEWTVSLMDTPGFGEFDSRVEALTTEALKSSTACVYITTYADLRDKANAAYLKFILEHDRDVFQGNRLIVVITKFDEQLADTDEEITEGEVKDETCQFVHEACAGVELSPNNVLPVSGKWAYNARMLAMTAPQKPTHYKYRDMVKKCLQNLSNQACGEGEKLSKILDELPGDELSAKLEEASGITTLEARIQAMSGSYFKTWVSKMTGDYNRYLTQAVVEMSRTKDELSRTLSDDEKQMDAILDFLTDVKLSRQELDDSMNPHKDPEVYGKFEENYEEDIENSELQQCGKKAAQKLTDKFRRQCLDKGKHEIFEFGPQHFDEDLKAFLKRAEKKLQEKFNSCCEFTNMHKVLLHHTGEMRARVEVMRANAMTLITSGKLSIPLKPSTAEISTGGAQKEILRGPSLGHIKEEVKISSIELSGWEKFQKFFRDLQELWSKLFGSAEPAVNQVHGTEPDDPHSSCTTESYRKWSSELDRSIKNLQRCLEEECDAYFKTIKEQTVKYFYNQYCCETRAQLTSFEAKFKVPVDKYVTELGLKIDQKSTKIRRLEERCDHLEKLKVNLREQAEEYLRKWEVK